MSAGERSTLIEFLTLSQFFWNFLIFLPSILYLINFTNHISFKLREISFNILSNWVQLKSNWGTQARSSINIENSKVVFSLSGHSGPYVFGASLFLIMMIWRYIMFDYSNFCAVNPKLKSILTREWSKINFSRIKNFPSTTCSLNISFIFLLFLC